MQLRTGKLPPDLLRRWLARVPIRDPRVLIGPRYGEDAAVIDVGDALLVAKTDPITFTAERIGWYALNVNANDVAAMGARPRWFLATFLLPAGASDEALADAIFSDLLGACEALDVTLCGGHAEVTPAVAQPVVVGQMLGEAPRGRLLTLANGRPGDAVLLTKGIAIEGTAILARDRAAEVRAAFGDEFQRRAAAFLDSPGLSVVREALIAAGCDGVRGMHDPTEGGLAEGLSEVAAAAGCGARIVESTVAVYPECAALCEHYGLRPWGLIASGALLIVVAPERADAVAARIRTAGIPVARIGELTGDRFLTLVTARGERPLEHSATDEITKAL